MPRCRKRDDRNTRPGTTTTSEADALVATAADLCARADELAALDAAALAWDGVADASRSDVCDHAATARVAARLQEVSASLNRIAAVDGEDPSRDPRHACAALAGAIASRLTISVDASVTELSVRARARAEEALERYAEAAGADPGSKDKTLRSSAEALRALADSNTSVHLPAHSPVLTEEGGVHHTPMGAAGLTRGAPWLADAYGAWAASHAAMGRELRDGKPNAPTSLTPLKDGSDGQLTEPVTNTYVSRWAECAVQAIDVVVEAAEAASKNDSAFDLFATAAADVRATGRLNPNPKPRAVLGPDVLFLLAELLDRTSSAVANWVTHQPRLWPGSRTATHLCVLHSDACRVDDALARAARTFKSIVNGHPHVGGDRSVSAASASRTRVRAALGKATLGVTKSITKTFEDAFKSAAKGTWGGKGYNPKEDIATTSPIATRVCEQMLAPLRLTLKSLDPRTAALVAPTAGASALRGYLARVLAEGKQGVKAKRGGPVRFGLDVEAIIEAVGVETIASLVAESQGASPEEPVKAATPVKAKDGDEEAGAGAAAMDAWRSAARDARAVATLGKGGDAAGLPETEAAAWKKVFA
ncbi:hypothetical protein N9M16_08720 [Candidatus Dependentiae bacterium]|nr:hypothetical protein [Candidatus Dependentiae bacterium]